MPCWAAGRALGLKDVRAVAAAVLNHRLILNYKARFDKIGELAIVDGLLHTLDEAGAESAVRGAGWKDRQGGAGIRKGVKGVRRGGADTMNGGPGMRNAGAGTKRGGSECKPIPGRLSRRRTQVRCIPGDGWTIARMRGRFTALFAEGGVFGPAFTPGKSETARDCIVSASFYEAPVGRDPWRPFLAAVCLARLLPCRRIGRREGRPD